LPCVQSDVSNEQTMRDHQAHPQGPVADPKSVALTEQHIAAAIRKANARVCAGSDRCFALPHLLEDARETCTPKGRCKVGWIVSWGGRESFDVWLEVATGLVKLIRQVDA
jgi:hypothetical protein